MNVKNIFFKIFQLLLIFLLFVSCIPIEETITTQSAPSLTPSMPLQTETSTPIPTITPTLTQTPTPTITFTPTVTFTPTNTPIPFGSEKITSENVENLTQLAQWGKGSISEAIWLENLQSWIISTPLGVYIYKGSSMKEIAFFESAQQFSLSLDNQKMALRFPDNQIKVANISDGYLENEFTFEVKIPWYQQDRINTLPVDQREMQTQRIVDYLSIFSASAFSMDNEFLALSYGDNHIWVWDLENDVLIADLYHDMVENVSQLAFSPDNQYLLTTNTFGQKSEVAFWQISELKLVWKKISAGHIVGHPFSSDGKYIALEMTYSYSKDASVLIWDTEYGSEIGRVSGRVAGNPFSPDGELLVTTSYSQVKLWSIPGVYLHKKFDSGLDWPKATFSDDGKYVLVNNSQQVWQVDDLTQHPELQVEPITPPELSVVNGQLRDIGHFTRLVDIFFLPDRSFRILGIDGINAYWWDGPSSEVVSILLPSEKDMEIKSGQLNALPIFSEDGKTLFYCAGEMLRSLDTETLTTTEITRCDTRSKLAYSEELDVIAKGDRTILNFIQVSSGEVIHTMQGHRKSIAAMEFSNEGGLFASGSTEFQGFGEIILWDTNPPIKLMYEGNRPYGVTEIAFSSDHQWMATYSGGYIQIWSVPEQRLFSNFSGVGTNLAFSPDSNLIVAGSYDGSIHIFRSPDGEELAVLHGHSGAVYDLIFTNDGITLLSISEDGSIRLWGIE